MPVLILANSKNKKEKIIIIKIGAKVEITFFLPGLKFFKSSEFETTEIELNAIASPASSGFKINPNPKKTLAAIGIPITL